MEPTPQNALRMYRRLVQETEQALPVLLLGYPTRAEAYAVLMEEGQSLGDAVIAAASLALTMNDAPPIWALLSNEAWIQQRSEAPAPGDLRPRDLAALGDPDVSEAAVFMFVARGTEWVYDIPFTRTEQGVQWGDLKQL